ncbi:hypothetical protein Q7C_2143 [Methylophaga frappieri]|uniref:Uncharacterized protein n=1 Tax=Methylophaga frappieri (strain ATCC BAA-2434 / DSM 25690 / JAM7) TaxID=754477 RepID=I1YK36_METFJ|nr:hypothetical protein Q7C_2143 [Methylophaga frappieri]
MVGYSVRRWLSWRNKTQIKQGLEIRIALPHLTKQQLARPV